MSLDAFIGKSKNILGRNWEKKENVLDNYEMLTQRHIFADKFIFS